MIVNNNVFTYQNFIRLPYNVRKDLINILTVPQLAALKYHWPFWARDKQIIPEELLDSKSKKFIWIIKSGRGFGKTRTGAETIRMLVDNYGYRRVSIVGADASEVRDIMIEGESGILSVYPFWNKPVYEPSKRRITFKSGAIATIFYGSEPDKSRGAQSDLIWCDEFIKWRYTEETLDNLLLGLRIGKKPICIITTTPRPIRILKELINDDRVIVTEGSTYENKDNLSDVFYSTIIKRYEGTRLGQQELYAELLDDNPNALWKRNLLDELRIVDFDINKFQRIVIGVDPMASAENENAMTGIVAAGQIKDKFYVLEDGSISGHPSVWAKQVIGLYYKYKADCIVVEKNNGGDMCESVVKNINNDVNVKMVWASRGKYVRAEPIAALYEQKRVYHCGYFNALEDEMCEWTGEKGELSPNRMDALVWAITFMIDRQIAPDAPSARKLEKTRRSEVTNLPV